MNGNVRKNIAFTALMWALGTVWGVAAHYIFPLIL